MTQLAVFLMLLAVGAFLGAVAVIGWAYQSDQGYRL